MNKIAFMDLDLDKPTADLRRNADLGRMYNSNERRSGLPVPKPIAPAPAAIKTRTSTIRPLLLPRAMASPSASPHKLKTRRVRSR